MTFSLLALGFAALYFLTILLLRLGLSRIQPCPGAELMTVSVIVAMKNEEQNVRPCLEALVNQDYPLDLIQIIVVDDGSWDGTKDILEEYHNKYSHLKIVRNDDGAGKSGGKKLSLNKAIAASQGEILLFTDADCVPPRYWVRSMIGCFAPEVGLVVGFSPLIDPKNSLLGELIRLDSIASGIVAAGSIGLGKAVTCTGRNIAYRRQVYDELNGFDKIMHSVSGDDDLFLQQVHKETSWKIKFSLDEDSMVPAYQSKTIKQFFTQKRRHLSAGKYYNLKSQIGYFLFHLSNLFLYLFFLTSLLLGQNIFLAILLFITKLGIDWLLFITAGKDFNVSIKFKHFLLYELFFISYHLIIAPTSWFGKIKWK